MGSKRQIINLTKEYRQEINSTGFMGKAKGAYARELLDFDTKDKDDNLYAIVVPDNTTSFNPSFFLGLFFPSMITLGLEVFMIKYRFDFSNIRSKELRDILDSDITECLKDASNLLK